MFELSRFITECVLFASAVWFCIKYVQERAKFHHTSWRLRDYEHCNRNLSTAIRELEDDLESASKYPTKDFQLSSDEYQAKAIVTAVYPKQHKIVYPAIGLADEAGEVLGKIKKMLRGDYALTDEKRLEIAKELSDTQWYTAALARDLGYKLSEIQQLNLDKLSDRAQRGVIKGDGDDR